MQYTTFHYLVAENNQQGGDYPIWLKTNDRFYNIPTEYLIGVIRLQFLTIFTVWVLHLFHSNKRLHSVATNMHEIQVQIGEQNVLQIQFGLRMHFVRKH